MFYSFSIFDLIPYLILYILLLILSLKSGSKYLWISAISLFLFSALRYGIGFDYHIYKAIIESGQELHWEPFSNAIATMSSKIEFTQLFFIINSFIVIMPLAYVTAKLSSKPSLVIFSFFLIPMFFLDSMSIIRNASAYSLIFLSYYYYTKHKYLTTIFVCVVACGFHSSAAISLILYFILQLKLTSKKILVICFLMALCFMFLNVSEFLLGKVASILPTFIEGKAKLYLDGSLEQGRFTKYVLFFIGFANILVYDKLVELDEKSKVYIMLYNFGLLLWGIFSFDHTLSLRLSTFFMLFIILLAPAYSKITFLKRSVNGSFVLTVFLTIFFISSFIVNISAYVSGGSSKISFLPYQTIFNNTDYINYL